MNTRMCKQCGERRPLELFRKYYGGRKGHYRVCKICEKINNREKYLSGKDGKTEAEISELNKINLLWHYQRKAGLIPPNTAKAKVEIHDNLDTQLTKYKQMSEELETVMTSTGVPLPEELQYWLVADLTDNPDFYLDDIYEKLQAKYRPVRSIDSMSSPVYDNTYRSVLQNILARFDAYEDMFYAKD